VYVITAPGFWYVGSTIRGAQLRFEEHMMGRNSNTVKLRQLVEQLGRCAFQQHVLERGQGNPIAAEQRWYDWYLANDIGETLNGKRPSGWPLPNPESNARRSASLQGHPNWSPKRHTAEARAHMSASLMGNTNSVGRTPWNKGQHYSVPHLRTRAACGDCGLVTNRGALQRHLNATGHHPV
jgi:hypothetical protein